MIKLIFKHYSLGIGIQYFLMCFIVLGCNRDTTTQKTPNIRVVLDEIEKLGKTFKYRESLALETQNFTDVPNRQEFPSIILNPGAVYKTKSMYKFSVEK